MRSSRWRLVVLGCPMAALMASSAAASGPDPAGTWRLKAEGKTVLVVTLAHDPKSPGGWSGEVVSPKSGYFTQSHMAGGLNGPPLHRTVRLVTANNGVWNLTVPAKKIGDAPDTYRFHPLSANTAEYGMATQGFPPLILTRGTANARVATGWDPKHEYNLDEPAPPTNPEMTALFEADQADRTDLAHIDWKVLAAADEERRARTRELMDAGELRSRDDFYHAALVFQHGSSPADYLLAHTLAVVAVAKGRRDATWIAAATLDRYLQAIGQKQVYGTQFSIPQNAPATQEPYDRTLISDALRAALGVPPLESQDEKRQEYDAQLRPTKL